MDQLLLLLQGYRKTHKKYKAQGNFSTYEAKNLSIHYQHTFLFSFNGFTQKLGCVFLLLCWFFFFSLSDP